MLGGAIALGIALALILAHELGHFVAARWCGLPVLSLSVGCGPTIWQHRWGETLYRLAAIPLGGAVRYREENRSGERRLALLACVLLAGPAASLLVGAVLLILASCPSGPAALGIGVEDTLGALRGIAGALAVLITTADIGQLGGPATLVRVAGAATRVGPASVLRLAGFVSLNMAVFNLLPIPVLDGGRLVLLALERMRGRALAREPLRWIAISGLAAVVALGLVAVASDIVRLMA